jgi:hypothetical protein
MYAIESDGTCNLTWILTKYYMKCIYRFVVSVAESESASFYVLNNHAIRTIRENCVLRSCSKSVETKRENKMVDYQTFPRGPTSFPRYLFIAGYTNLCSQRNKHLGTRLSADEKVNFSGQDSSKCHPLTWQLWANVIHGYLAAQKWTSAWPKTPQIGYPDDHGKPWKREFNRELL